MYNYTTKDIARFWSKVNKDSSVPEHCPELGTCWEWTASKSRKGYGHFGLSDKCYQAHRVAWEITFSPIPEKLLVLHACDNRSCVNPCHLFLGTNDDNMKDMVAKGRQGKRIVHRKLSYEIAEEIRKRYATGGIYQFELAAEYGVCQRTINNVIHKRLWP